MTGFLIDIFLLFMLLFCVSSYAGFTDHSKDVSTTPLYNNTGVLQTNPHAVIGSTSLVLGVATVILSDASSYSTSSSYVCSGSDTSGNPLAVSTQNQSGSSFKLFGTLSDTVTYNCIGN